MTFLELERKCKQRRLFRVVKAVLFIFVILFAAAGGYFYTHQKPETKNVNIEPAKKPVKVKSVTDVNKSAVKPDVKTQNSPKSENKMEKLHIYLDLNLTESKSIPEVKKTEKKRIEQTNSVNLKSTALPSYETCISLSEKFYNQGNYKEALKWAKNANIQDNKKPESWIMSAKSLVKLGKKEDAVKILKVYDSYHKDEKIKKLLGELNEQGN